MLSVVALPNVPWLRMCALVLSMILPSLTTEVAFSQTYATFASFDSLPAAALATLQVKLTVMPGIGDYFPSIVLRASGTALDMAAFEPFERPGVPYVNDHMPLFATEGVPNPEACEVSPQDLEAMIDRIATIAQATDGGVDSGGYISFALLRSSGSSNVCFESILSDTTARELLTAMRAALVANVAAWQALTDLACGRDLLGATTQTELTSVTITMSGVHAVRAERNERYAATVQVTNTGAPVSGPVILTLTSRNPAVSLVNGSGYTCLLFPPGSPYVLLPVGPIFERHESVSYDLQFDNASQDELELNWNPRGGQGIWPRVYYGAGER